MAGFKWVAILVVAVMAILGAQVLINDSLGHGAGLDVFLAGTKSPWQAFINQDLVSGLLFAVAWLIYREQPGRAIDTIAWVWMAMWWGNIVVAAYVLLALRQSNGDPQRFFMGARGGGLAQAWLSPNMVVRAILLLLAAGSVYYLVALLGAAAGPVAIAGALLGMLPVALSLVLLAFPPAPHAEFSHRR
ncbi:hypothetical protein [Rhizorhabdus argentea]|uniref:hypothetical protein n=1 Tax=Rhizorhabdus argentea TaxID=1387174 RepID=UPI0030EE686E